MKLDTYNKHSKISPFSLERKSHIVGVKMDHKVSHKLPHFRLNNRLSENEPESTSKFIPFSL